MKSFVIESSSPSHWYHDTCPYCGFYSLNFKDYPKHMNKNHNYFAGFKWEVVETKDKTQTNTYWILLLAPKKEKEKKK